jgi:hypothetical protein
MIEISFRAVEVILVPALEKVYFIFTSSSNSRWKQCFKTARILDRHEAGPLRSRDAGANAAGIVDAHVQPLEVDKNPPKNSLPAASLPVFRETAQSTAQAECPNPSLPSLDVASTHWPLSCSSLGQHSARERRGEEKKKESLEVFIVGVPIVDWPT